MFKNQSATEHTQRPAERHEAQPSADVDYAHRAREVIRDIIEPVSGKLDDRVDVQVSTDPPVLSIQHTARSPQGRDHTFRYEIELDARSIKLGGIPQLDQTVSLGIPAALSGEQIRHAQDVFRCACIHDPVLYGRFNRTELRLEDYQNQAVEKSLLDLSETGRAMIVLGTGGGKTQIAFEIAAAELGRATKLEDAKVVFIVNNNMILSEAGDKFVERFNDEFSKSHAHGGKRDISGNVIFTTPGSILGENRLEETLGNKKQVFLIFDEVHHVVANQPDAIIRRAEAYAKEHGVELKILGMTATETRPDLRNVLAYFNNHISFEQSAADLTARGFLAPFRYHARDSWLYPDGKAPRVILPGDDLAAERRQLLNSDAAFEHVEAALDAHVRDREDKRTLIVAPSVALAGDFCSYVSRNPDYAGAVVRLTAEDRLADPERFRDTYEAWKKGQWPAGSKFANEPVPTIVVAVDLFKEGTDAPGVRTIINWADTNSLIVFLQTLGRGFRPAPFKTNLEVVDMAGTFRKVHLLQWLGNVTQQNGEPALDGSGRERSDDSPDGSGAARALCELAPDVSSAVQSFLADVPATLARRYPGYHYSAIPAAELERLHECLARRAGHEDTASFDRFLVDVGSRLVRDSSNSTAIEIREQLLKLFYQYEEGPASGMKDVDREPTTLLVHAHLLQSLQSCVPEFAPEHLARVFPEFSADAIHAAKTIGGNLMALRHRHFNLGHREMAQELFDKVVYPGKLANDQYAAGTISEMVNFADESSLVFATAEGRRPERGSAADATPSQYEQRALVAAYLRHPDIEGKLTEQDFLLPRKEFENQLALKGLVTPSAEKSREASGGYLRFLSDRLGDIEKSIVRGNEAELQKSLEVAEALLGSPTMPEFLEGAEVKAARFKALSDGLERLEAEAARLPALKGVCESLDRVLACMSSRETTALCGNGGHTFETSQKPESKSIDVCLTRRLSSGEPEQLVKTSFSIKTDLARPHIVLPSSTLREITVAWTKLSEGEKERLVSALVLHLEKVSARLSAGDSRDEGDSGNGLAVVVLPSVDSRLTNSLEFQLEKALLRDSALNVLLAGESLSVSTSTNNLEPSVHDAMRSRMQDLTEESVKRMRQLASASGSPSFLKELAHAYEVTHFVRTRLAPHLKQWESLFEDARLGTSSLRHLEVARWPLRALLDSNVGVSSKQRESMQDYTALLRGVSNAGGFDADSALSVAAWAVWNRFPLWAYSQRTSPLRELNTELPAFFRRLARSQEMGVSFPEGEQANLREVLTTIFDAFNSAKVEETAYLPGVSADKQKEEALALRDRIRSISLTIQGLLDSSVSPAEVGIGTAADLGERKEGHPFFNAEKEVVLFLSGSKKSPVVHVDPECAVLLKDLANRKRRDLPVGPVTIDKMESEIGYKEKAQCCRACKTPRWTEHEQYSDVKASFQFDERRSAVLPDRFVETKV